MDDGDGSRRNRKPNYSRDEVFTIVCGVQENKFNLLKKSCTVSANKVKQAGWKSICDRLNFFNPDRQRTVEEVRKKWKDLSAQARNDLMCKRIAASSGTEGEGEDGQHGAAGKDQKEAPAGEFTPLILAILGEVGSIDMSAEDTELLNINLSTLGTLGDPSAEQEAMYDAVVIHKQDNASETSQHSQNDAEMDDADSRKRMRKPNYTKKDVLTLIQGVSDHKFSLLQKICTHSSNKVKTEGWATICNSVNSYNPDVVRTTEELRKKWKDLSKQARQDLANLRAAMASGSSKSPNLAGEFTALCLPILADAGLCDVTAEEINALKVNNVATVISLQQAAGPEFVTTSQGNVLQADLEKECDSFVGDSASFGNTGLIGAPTAVGAPTLNMATANPSGQGEFALSTLASVSASKLKEKLREKLASGAPASQSDIQDFQAAQAELQAVGVEVRLIENHRHHHSHQQHEQQQQQQQQHQHQHGLENNGSAQHQHQHIALEDPAIISSTPSSGATIITNNNNPQQQQQQHTLPPGVTIHTTNLPSSAPAPQQLFRASLFNSDGSSPLKRKISHSTSSGGLSNIIPSGNMSTMGHTLFPIPVSIHPAPPLSTSLTVLTGTPVVAGNISPTSPPTNWLSEKQALEREKLQAEVEILRLQKVKLRLEIEALLQQRQPDSCQLLEDCLK